MPQYKLKINKKEYSVNCSEEMPLLWVLRDLLNLKGTKFGCGQGLCGACTIHVNGEAIRSCSYLIQDLEKSEITTIETTEKIALKENLNKAWIKYNVPQCGYCQPGQIMSALSFLKTTQRPSINEIKEFMDGNICRCGTYIRIQNAIYYAAHGKEYKE